MCCLGRGGREKRGGANNARGKGCQNMAVYHTQDSGYKTIMIMSGQVWGYKTIMSGPFEAHRVKIRS